MPKKNKLLLSRGYRRYIRETKAKIRKEVIDKEEQQKMIDELYAGFEAKK